MISMEDPAFWQLYGQATKTAAGFFWKSGWAFVLGYGVSAMVRAFVAGGRLTPYLGDADTGVRAVALRRRSAPDPDRRHTRMTGADRVPTALSA